MINLQRQSNNIPTVLVIFGATGDLIQKKIAPALFHLYHKKRLPELFRVIGVAKGEADQQHFRNFIATIVRKQKKNVVAFTKLWMFHQGRFENRADYKTLERTLHETDQRWGVCSNKLFYIAASPKFYETILKNLVASGLTAPCAPEEGWSRVIVEKPFGKDLETAQRLEQLITRLFKETQIYRIDHYLAKEMVQNILAFRFANNIFEQGWSNQLIEKIEIRLWETRGVEKRGIFYDSIGALRDVGQNHLLQLLALVTMDAPIDGVDAIRSARTAILKKLRVPSLQEIRRGTYRAQYRDYRKIIGVANRSMTETYFKTTAFLDTPRWRGVPIILEGGKRLANRQKEVVITFRDRQNKIVISLEPYEKIVMEFWSKKPGLDFETEKRELTFVLRKQKAKKQYTEEYEKLLLDCIAGDQTLFVTSGEIAAMWKYTDPIVRAWKRNAVPLQYYKPNSSQAIVESKNVGESGRCRI